MILSYPKFYAARFTNTMNYDYTSYDYTPYNDNSYKYYFNKYNSVPVTSNYSHQFTNGYDKRFEKVDNSDEIYNISVLYEKFKELTFFMNDNISTIIKIAYLHDNDPKEANILSGGLFNDFDFYIDNYD
jgi:hypothetical protein